MTSNKAAVVVAILAVAAAAVLLLRKSPGAPEPPRPPGPPTPFHPAVTDPDPPIAPDIDGYARALKNSRNMYYGMLQTEQYEQAVRLLKPQGPSASLASAQMELGLDLLRWNRIDEALENLDEAVAFFRTGGNEATLVEALYQRGVAQLRQGMLDNCLPKQCAEA